MKERRLLLLLLICTVTSAYRSRGVPQCSPLSTVITLHPHEEDCGLYYRCEDGNLALFSCPYQYVYSDTDKSCVICSDDIQGCEDRCSGGILSKDGGGGGGGGGEEGGGGGGGGGNCGGGGGGGGGGSGGGGGGGGGGNCSSTPEVTTTKQPTTTTQRCTTTTQQCTTTTQQCTTTTQQETSTIPCTSSTGSSTSQVTIKTTERYTTQRTTTEIFTTPSPSVTNTIEVTTATFEMTTSDVILTTIPSTTEEVESTTEQQVTETSTEASTTTPEVTTPEVTTPEVTTPEATTPEATTEATTPAATTPEATTPEATTPEATTPEATTTEQDTTTQNTTAFPTEETTNAGTTTDDSYCSVEIKCTDETLYLNLPYKPDCTRYIYCDDNNEEVIRKCPGNKHFSPVELVCTDAELANCPLCSSPTTEAATTTDDSYCSVEVTCTDETLYLNLPYKPDCTKYIYCDNNNVEDIRKCPGDKHFSPVELVCTAAELANCPLCSSPTTEAATTTDDSYCSVEVTCTDETLYLNLPYKPDCTRYIYCDDNNEEIIRKCPGNKLFSPVELVCTDAELANCPLCSSPTTEAATTTDDSYCSVEVTCTDETLYLNLPYKPDCTRYIYCDNNNVEDIRKCPGDKHFSPVELVCTDAELANCPVCSSPTTEAAPITDDSYCSVDIDCTDETLYLTLPYKPDCTKYIYCDNNNVEDIRKCPGDKHFSPVELVCTSAELANCPVCSSPTEIPAECPTQKSCTLEDNFLTLPYVSDCRKFIYCKDGNEILSLCPFLEQYSPTENSCMEPELANCPKCTPSVTTEIPIGSTEAPTGSTEAVICPAQRQCTPEDVGFTIPYINDCRLYIYCNEVGDGTLSMCPISERFSPTKNFCVHVSESDCYSCNPASVFPSTTVGFEVATVDPNCVVQQTCNHEDIFENFPYLPDCTRYIHCDENGEELLRICPDSKHFSPVERFCMEPEEANCPDCSKYGPNQNGPTQISPNRCIQKTCDLTTLFSFLPYVEDCTRYVYCDGTIRGQIRVCPAGQHFDAIQEMCVEIIKANCLNCSK